MGRTSSAPSGTRLKSGTLGLISLATFGAVMMSPALGLYGQFGPMASLVGATTPLVYLAALLVSLPTAVSYALLNRALPSAGSAFTWVWVALSPTLGTWVGLMMIAYYTVALIMPPILFGLFFADLLSFLGVAEANLVSWTGGVILVTVFVAWLTYRGIELSTRSSLVFVLIEIAVVLALSATIFSVKIMQGEFSFAPLNPAHTTGGFSAFWQAMVLGVLSYAGYDVISTVAEEAKAPRRLLPKATLLATVGVGLFWALNAWAFSLSVPVSRVAELTASGLSAAVPIGREFWGQGELLVILTGLTAAVGVYVATAVGASRAVYAMARQGTPAFSSVGSEPPLPGPLERYASGLLQLPGRGPPRHRHPGQCGGVLRVVGRSSGFLRSDHLHGYQRCQSPLLFAIPGTAFQSSSERCTARGGRRA